MPSCNLCRSSLDDELHLGKFHINRKVAVHQNCLYLSSNLVQRGTGQGHILYFRFDDILAESERTKNLACCYCHKFGANIGCCKSYCRRSFHTYCGLKHGAQNQFVGTFQSFCHAHNSSFKERPKPNEECAICFDQLIAAGRKFCCSKYINGKCCNNGWYHKDCLQRYANSAGYFFKCPLCNNSDKFRMVALWGVSVPDRDASWEEGDAFADQLVRPTVCTAKDCVSSQGRSGRVHNLLYCVTCGSNPKHKACTSFKMEDYNCDDCFAMRNCNSNVCGNTNVLSLTPPVTRANSNSSMGSDDEEYFDRFSRIRSYTNSHKLSQDLDPFDRFNALSNSKKDTPNCSSSSSSSSSSCSASTNGKDWRPNPNCSDSQSDSDDDDDRDPLELLTSIKMSANNKTTSPNSAYSGIEKENVGRNAKLPQETKPVKTSTRACASARASPYIESGHRALRDRGQQNRVHIAARPRSMDIKSPTRPIRSSSRRTLPSHSSSSEEDVQYRRTRPRYVPYQTQESPCPSLARTRRQSMRKTPITQALSPMDMSCVANRTRARSRK